METAGSRGPFTEAKIKTDMRETPQCSLFLTAQHTTLYIQYVQYRNIHTCVPSHTQTDTQHCQHIPPTALVFAAVCLSLCAIVTLFTPQLLPHSGTSFLCCDLPTCVQPITKSHTYALSCRHNTHVYIHRRCLLQALGQTSHYYRVTFPEGLHVFHT